MKYVTAGYEPQDVLQYFEDLARIPRGSGNCAAVAEYVYNWGKNLGLDAYKDEYEGLSLFDRPLGKTLFSQDDKGICINAENPRKTPIYCGGIKQMLSHYIGVGNYATQKSAEHSIFKYADNEDILLGEIMFDFQEAIRRSSDKLENYKKVYSELAERINRHG